MYCNRKCWHQNCQKLSGMKWKVSKWKHIRNKMQHVDIKTLRERTPRESSQKWNGKCWHQNSQKLSDMEWTAAKWINSQKWNAKCWHQASQRKLSEVKWKTLTSKLSETLRHEMESLEMRSSQKLNAKRWPDDIKTLWKRFQPCTVIENVDIKTVRNPQAWNGKCRNEKISEIKCNMLTSRPSEKGLPEKALRSEMENVDIKTLRNSRTWNGQPRNE